MDGWRFWASAAEVADPASDRWGCVGDLPEGQSLSLVLDRNAFEEDCARAAIVVSPLTAPATCAPAQVYDERRLQETGAVGLVWTAKGLVETAARAPLEDRPWSPAPRRPRDERLRRPGSRGADPADTADPP
jgi:competence protein ComEC